MVRVKARAVASIRAWAMAMVRAKAMLEFGRGMARVGPGHWLV